jgi:hypothetical protein
MDCVAGRFPGISIPESRYFGENLISATANDKKRGENGA